MNHRCYGRITLVAAMTLVFLQYRTIIYGPMVVNNCTSLVVNTGGTLTPVVNILFAVVAIGNDSLNADVVNENVNAAIAMGRNQSKYNVDCIIFSYAFYYQEPQWLHEMEDGTVQSPCEIVRMFKMNYIGFLKMIVPALLRDHYKYLFLSIDDVALTAKYGATFGFEIFFDIVELQQQQVASSVMEGTVHAHLRPRELTNATQIGRFVDMIEFQAIAFTADSWACMYELVDTEYPSGWGIDYWFWNYCVVEGKGSAENWKLGVIDTMKVVHNPFHLPSRGADSGFGCQLVRSQINSWSNDRGIRLKGKSFNHQTLGFF